MLRVRRFNGLLHGRVVRRVVGGDTLLHLGHAELAAVDGGAAALAGIAPDKADAQAGLLARVERGGPGRVQHVRVDVVGVAVRVDVGARELGRQQRGAGRRQRFPQHMHVGVFARAQARERDGVAEVGGVLGAAVR